MTISNFLNLISSNVRRHSQHFLKKPTLITFLGLIIIFIVLYFTFSPSQTIEETITVNTGGLKQVVKVTGQVQSSHLVNLAFQTLGSVSYIGVKVGDEAHQGKVLATLQSGDAQASILQAKAQLESVKATLDQLKQGYRKEEIAVKQQTVDNSRNSLEQVHLSLPDTIRNVDSTTRDVIKNKLSALFTGVDYYYRLSFVSCDQGLQSLIETDRTKLETTLFDFQNKSATISSISSFEEIDSVFEDAYTVTTKTNNLINSISKLLFAQCSTQNTTLDTYRTILSTAQVAMISLFSEITTRRSSLNIAKNTLLQATRDLELANSGTDPYKLRAQYASVSQAEAQVAQAQANYQKTIITAPFSGTISEVFVVEGETVSSGKTVISMLANNSFEVEAKIPEVDIVKVKTDSPAEITLDAYGKGVIFPAKVTRVNPTAITEGSVPMYKAIVTFTGSDERVKSGMTANVNIITENKLQVMLLPARFVETKDGISGSVVVRRDNQDVAQVVSLGVRGEDGLIEVLSGLNVGDEVVAPITGARSAQKQTN